MNACPECGGRIEATAKVYLADIELVPDAKHGCRIASSTDQSKGIGVELSIYCENDHDLDGDVFEAFGGFPVTVTLDGGDYRTD